MPTVDTPGQREHVDLDVAKIRGYYCRGCNIAGQRGCRGWIGGLAASSAVGSAESARLESEEGVGMPNLWGGFTDNSESLSPVYSVWSSIYACRGERWTGSMSALLARERAVGSVGRACGGIQG